MFVPFQLSSALLNLAFFKAYFMCLLAKLKLFELAGVSLYHGWLVDPDSQEHAVVSRISGAYPYSNKPRALQILT